MDDVKKEELEEASKEQQYLRLEPTSLKRIYFYSSCKYMHIDQSTQAKQ
ncbi:MAG: hypothetical protein FD143_3790 [Ignavibacteria bacterium]|nr:MAG: hypothetical protein FD143_3790 [Ignavibacteria bacterium]